MTGPADARPQRRRRRRRALAETAIMIVVAVLLAGLVRTFSHPPLAGVVARRPPRVPRYLNLVFKPGA